MLFACYALVCLQHTSMTQCEDVAFVGHVNACKANYLHAETYLQPAQMCHMAHSIMSHQQFHLKGAATRSETCCHRPADTLQFL